MSEIGFQQAFLVIIGSEGGYSRNAADPGNWDSGKCGQGACQGTKFGISSAAYPDLDIAALTQDDAGGIYKRDYWDKIAGDQLPPALALLAFDAAINNGQGNAIRWLQLAVDARPVDGVLGPLSLAAVKATISKVGIDALCAEYLAQRLMFMAGLASWHTFGLGWARRLCRLPYQSMLMRA